MTCGLEVVLSCIMLHPVLGGTKNTDMLCDEEKAPHGDAVVWCALLDAVDDNTNAGEHVLSILWQQILYTFVMNSVHLYTMCVHSRRE